MCYLLGASVWPLAQRGSFAIWLTVHVCWRELRFRVEGHSALIWFWNGDLFCVQGELPNA